MSWQRERRTLWMELGRRSGMFARPLAPEPGLARGLQTRSVVGFYGRRAFAVRTFAGGLGRAMGVGGFLGSDKARA